MNKTKKFIDLIFRPRIMKQLLSMHSGGYLYEIGWINSFINKIPVDKNSNPIPWVTYPYIDFISERLNSNMDIFEYGSGNSTLWYARKVNSVISVEHDKLWFEKVKNDMPNNVNLSYQDLSYSGDYSTFPKTIDKKFDIVIVDGRDRVNCMKNSINAIKENGVIVLDDSERKQYIEGIDYLLNKDFKKIDFWGISPGLFYRKSTTVFYKKNNCLGI